MDKPDWEWREEDPAAFADLDAQQVHAAYALGELVSVIILEPDEDNSDGSSWLYYSVLSKEREGFGGYEPINSFASLDEAKSFAEEMKEDLVAMVRDDPV